MHRPSLGADHLGPIARDGKVTAHQPAGAGSGQRRNRPAHEAEGRAPEIVYGAAMRTFKLAPQTLADDLAAQGYATVPLLAADACRQLASVYDDDSRFRKRVVMEQHAYGKGEYKYLFTSYMAIKPAPSDFDVRVTCHNHLGFMCCCALSLRCETPQLQQLCDCAAGLLQIPRKCPTPVD